VPVLLGDDHLTLDDLDRLAGDPEAVFALSSAGRERVERAHTVVRRYAEGDEPVYGLNTGLGGNLAHRLDRAEMESFQAQMIRGRSVGVGEPLPEAVSRAALIARAHGMALGGTGITPAVLDLMVDLLNAGVSPVIPSRGSIGAGDLTLAAAIGLLVLGRGEAWQGGRRAPAAAMLAERGLTPVALGPKDGLSLLNTSAVSVAQGALVLAEAAHWLHLSAAVAALAFEGYAANPSIFDPRLADARPARAQQRAAAWFRELLSGSSLLAPGSARKIQDALSFRCLSQVYAAALDALAQAREGLELELNSRSDSPLILLDDGLMLSSGNFHTPAIALAFDQLALALCHLATISAQRSVKLMTPALSGLPKYLSPVGGASAGLVPMQKTIAALLGEVRLKANPASLDAMPVSETVEDHAPQTPLTIRKLEEQLLPFGWIVAIEALVAAQAVDLRAPPALGRAAAVLMPAIRAVAPPLEEDRESGWDAAEVHRRLQDRTVIAELGGPPA